MAAAREPTDSAAPGTPAAFQRAVALLRGAAPRPEVRLAEIPAPGRLAPFAFALTGEVVSGDEELANGRLVLLHDPAGHEAWEGAFRLVTLVRATVDGEMAADPLLAGVGWSWLRDALADHGAGYAAAAGTVTRASSESFGDLAGSGAMAEVELRASWTPTGDEFDVHLTAWVDVL